MQYAQALDYLYTQLPMFTRDGAAAYKLGLGNIVALCEALGNPHLQFKSVHVAGTNGKGSTSHMLASILHEAGYRVGLYTSPHLIDFRERIRINGVMLPEDFVCHFVQKIKQELSHIEASFFEITVAMAFSYFAQQHIDVAIVEVGLGGLYDSTNIITPELCIITNIGWDHMNLLGDTLPQIALQKAGIIKPHVPIVVSTMQAELQHVFAYASRQHHAPLYYADEVLDVVRTPNATPQMQTLKIVDRNEASITTYQLDLLGNYQAQNLKGVILACQLLQRNGYSITQQHMQLGLSKVRHNTGLRGRFEVLQNSPTVICDVAHNTDGISALLAQVQLMPHTGLHIIMGFVSDKDVASILPLLPHTAMYYATQAQIPRAMPYAELAQTFLSAGLPAVGYATIAQAYSTALLAATESDVVVICGSFFILPELAAFTNVPTGKIQS